METLRLVQQSLPGFVLPIARLCVWLVLLSAIFVPLERLFAVRPQAVFRKQIGADLGYYFLSGLVPSLFLGTPLALLAWSAHALLPPGIAATVADWPTWLRVVAALVVGEFGFYWGHRWSHQIPLLWRFHAIHHSATQVDWLVNTRAHPVDMIFTRLCGLVPLYVLGLAAPLAGSASVIPVLVLLLGVVWGFFVHANLRWRFGPLEWVLASPAFHHWHHTNDGPAYVDKNYAAMLPCIDRLFGTHYLPLDRRPLCYGTDTKVPPQLLEQLLEPFMPQLVVLPSAAAACPSVAAAELRRCGNASVVSGVAAAHDAVPHAGDRAAGDLSDRAS